MKNRLKKIKEEVLQQLEGLKDKTNSDKNKKELWRALDIKYLGRKGELSNILKGIKDLTSEERKDLGYLANETKNIVQEAFTEFKNKFLQQNLEEEIDITLPANEFSLGHLHPITLIKKELEDSFRSLGFDILTGPELESDYFNFQALNIPEYHPARDMQDTFYINRKDNEEKIDNKLVLRTHTSPMQVRSMLESGAPLKVIVPGKVFRNESLDASHEHTFYQLEGIMIDKNISISNMIAVMEKLLYIIFKEEVPIRIRPGFFPFVEPGIEIDMQCRLCKGKGCPVCKQSGWLEIFPGGMIHPNVLEAGGIDSKIYSGFAFGLGLTRLAMMKYNIKDIRLFNSGDLRFLEQF
jgi:phenylalanyl-tRNA synthetase alpha chain